MHPFTNSSPRGTGGKINTFMGLAVLGAPEDTVNNTLCMAGSPVIGPKICYSQGPACGGKNKNIATLCNTRVVMKRNKHKQNNSN